MTRATDRWSLGSATARPRRNIRVGHQYRSMAWKATRISRTAALRAVPSKTGLGFRENSAYLRA